jgi:hypothetical protein
LVDYRKWKTSVEHVICDDHLDNDRKKIIDHFNATLTRTNLSDENFQVEGDSGYQSFLTLDVDLDMENEKQ